MQIDPQADRAMIETLKRPAGRQARRPWLQLIEAVMALCGGSAELVRHTERAWASVTFSGTRHTMVLAFHGAEGLTAGEHFIAALPDHEFAIPRLLVADATVIATEHGILPEPMLVVEIELLLLEDA
jgi:hypothetical protein